MSDPLSNLGSRVDLQLRQGTKFETSVTFTNSDSSPVDLTGSTLTAQIRKLPTDAVSMGNFTVTVSEPTSGVAELDLLVNLPCGNSIMDDASGYWWALKLTDAVGNVSTPIWGEARVAP